MIRYIYMNGNDINYCSVTSVDLIPVFNPLLTEVDYRIIEDEELDSLDQMFMHAYEMDSNKDLVLNLTKAKEIQKNKIRRERELHFKKLDYEFMRALEQNDTVKQSSIVSRKQELRDMPSLVDLADTIEDIKSVRVNNFSGILCIAEDLQTVGMCMNGAKEWFDSVGWDFKDFVRNGKMSDDVIALNDIRALTVVEAAYNRVNK